MLRRRDAFTLVEMLIVMSILSVLIAVLLPALQTARDSARRVACTSNLRQVALAAINYEAARGRFPSPGKMQQQSNGVCVPHRGRQFSWIVEVLPFMEEQTLFDEFDFSRSVFDQGNSNPAQRQPNALLCPADSAEGRYYVDEEFSSGTKLSKGNYAAWASPFHLELHDRFPAAIATVEGIRAQNVARGMSKTFMVSEVRTRALESDQRGAWAVPWNGSSLLAVDAHLEPIPGSEHGFCLNASRPFAHMTPNHIGYGKDEIYECDADGAEAERMPCVTWSVKTGLTRYLSSAPRSNHIGGVNVSLMDGSCRFVTDHIDPFLMAAHVNIKHMTRCPPRYESPVLRPKH